MSIPLAGTVYVASAKPASIAPTTSRLPNCSWNLSDSTAISRFRRPRKKFQRGSVANMIEDTEVLADRDGAIDPYDDFKFQTDITVADIHGGEKLTRDESRPAPCC